MAIRRYQDFIAWQLADQLESEVRRLVRGSPAACRDLRFRSQLVDAVSRAPSDFAEGFLRCSPGDFARFLDYALGSIGETERRLNSGIKDEYFAAPDCQLAFRLGRRCLKAMVRLKQQQIRYARDARSRRRGKRASG